MAGVAISGAGADAHNVILTRTNAYVRGSAVKSFGKLDVDATNTASIHAAVVSASASIAVGGIAGVGGSLGVAVARNYIGWNPGHAGTFDYSTSDSPSAIVTGDTVKIIGGADDGNTYEYIGSGASGSGTWLAGLNYHNRSQWRLLYDKVVDYATGENPASIITGKTVKISAGVNAGNVYEYIGTATLNRPDGPAPSGETDAQALVRQQEEANWLIRLDYSDKSQWRLINLGNYPAEIQAYILDSTVDATGVLTLDAVSDEEIDATVFAGSVSISGGLVGVAVSGAGACAENRIATLVQAYVQGDKDNKGIKAASVGLNAKDTSGIESFTGAVSVAASGGLVGVSLSIGVSVAYNEIDSDVVSFIKDVDAGVTSTGATGDISVAALEDAEIDATAAAASVAFAVGGVGVSVSGAGVACTNVILGSANAVVDNSVLGSARDVLVDADNTSGINAEVAAISAAVGGGVLGGGACSIGVAVARNLIGYTADGVCSPIEVRAFLRDSSVDAARNLTVSATSTQDIDGFVGAGSVAASAGGFVGIGLSGAGASAVNRVAANVKAFIDGTGSTGVIADSISLTASDTSDIDATVGTASVGVGVGLVGAAISVGISIASNDINNSVSAYIANGESVKTRDGGAITISATEGATINALGVAASAAIGGGLVGISFAGAGVDVTNVILNKTNAYIQDSVVGAESAKAGNVTITATDTSSIDAEVGGLAIAAAGGFVAVGVAVGVATATNLIGYTRDGTADPAEVQAYIEDSSINSLGALSLTAEADQTITATVLAGSLALAGGAVAIAGAGAGTSTRNCMRSLIKAFIDGTDPGEDGTGAMGINAASVALKADDDSEITAFTGSAALAGSVGLVSGSVSISLALARNEIANEVDAYVRDADVTATGASGISIQAIDAATITATATAASVAADASWFGGITVAGGGADAFNTIQTKTRAYVDTSETYTGTSELTATSGDITVDASDESTITAEVTTTNAAFAGSGGYTGAIAIGGARARNYIGWGTNASDTVYDYTTASEPASIITGKKVKITSGPDTGVIYEYIGTNSLMQPEGAEAWLTLVNYADSSLWRQTNLVSMPAEVKAWMKNTDAEAQGAVTVEATEAANIDALISSESASIAGGLIALAVAGAGVSIENRINTDVAAYVDTCTVDAGGAVTIEAEDSSMIDATAEAVSFAAAIGLGGAASVSLSCADNEISNQVQAYATSAKVTTDAGNLTITATESATITSASTAASMAISSILSVASSGATADVTIKTITRAYADPVELDITGAVVIDAISTATGTAGSTGNASATGFISISGAVTEATVTVQPTTEARLGGYTGESETRKAQASGAISVIATQAATATATAAGGSEADGIGVAVGASTATALIDAVNDNTPTVKSSISGGKVVSTAGNITVKGVYNADTDSKVVNGSSAQATAYAAAGGMVGIGGANANATSAADVDTSVAPAAALSASAGAITVESDGCNHADALATGTQGGLAGVGESLADAVVGGAVKAKLNGAVDDADAVIVKAVGSNDADAEALANSKGAVTVSGTAAYAEVTSAADVEALVSSTAALKVPGGTVDVLATGDNSATAAASGRSGAAVSIIEILSEAKVGGGVKAQFDGDLPDQATDASRLWVKALGENIATATTTVKSVSLADSSKNALATATITSNADVEALVGQDASIVTSGEVLVDARLQGNKNKATADALGKSDGILGANSQMDAEATINGGVTADFDGDVPAASLVTVQANGGNNADAEVDVSGFSAIFGGKRARAGATVGTDADVIASVGSTAEIHAGSLYVKAISDNDAVADSDAKTGAAIASSKSQPVATVGGATRALLDGDVIDATGTIEVEATGTSDARAITAVSAKGVGAGSNATPEATVSSNVVTQAQIGSQADIASPNADIVVRATSDNLAWATAEAVAAAGVAVSNSAPTATCNGSTQAALLGDVRKVSGGNDSAGAKTINIQAQGIDASIAQIRSESGGAISVETATSSASTGATTTATIGDTATTTSGSVIVTSGAITVKALGMTDADSSTRSTTGGGVNITNFSANATVTPTVTATVGNKARLKSDGLITIIAEHNKLQQDLSDGTFGAATDVDGTANTITFDLPHGLVTNDVVTYDALGLTSLSWVDGLTPVGTLLPDGSLATGQYTVIVPATTGGDKKIRIGAAFIASEASVDVDTDTITFPVAHNLIAGDSVIYYKGSTGSTAVGGLTEGKTYTVFKVDDVSIKLKDPLTQSTTPVSTDASHIDSDSVDVSNNFYNGAPVTYFGSGTEYSFTSKLVDVEVWNDPNDVPDQGVIPKRVDEIIQTLDNDKIYLGNTSGLSVGTQMVYWSSSPISGLTNGGLYWIAAKSDSNTTIQLKSNIIRSAPVTFVRSGSGDQIVRTTGSWVTDGFVQGQSLWISGSGINNGTAYTVKTVTATTLTLDQATTVTATSMTATVNWVRGATSDDRDQIVRTTGDWSATNFANGQQIVVAGDNAGTYEIHSVVGNTITLTVKQSVTAANGVSATITGPAVTKSFDGCIRLNPTKTGAAAEVLHTLQRVHDQDLPGLVDGRVYFVYNASSTSFQLVSTPTSTTPISLDPNGWTGGTHKFEVQGVNLTSVGAGDQHIVMDIASGSGTQKMVLGSLDNFIGAPSGDLIATASAAGGGGGAIDVKAATATASTSPTVSVSVQSAAVIEANIVEMKTDAIGNAQGFSTNSGGGVVSVGDANATANVYVQSTITVASTATVTALDDLTIDSRVETDGQAKASTKAGGLGSGVDSRATTNLDYVSKADIQGTLVAGDALKVEAHTAVDGYVYAYANAKGLGADSDANDAGDKGIRIGKRMSKASTQVLIGPAANLTANTVALLAKVDKIDALAEALAKASALGADSDARASIDVAGSATVVLDTGSEITGNESVLLQAIYDHQDLYADPRAECSGLGGDTDSRANVDVETQAKVIGRNEAMIWTARLDVDAKQVVDQYDRSPSRDGAAFDSGENESNGDPDFRRHIYWEATVTMLGEPNPVLTIDESGKIVAKVNVELENGRQLGYTYGASEDIEVLDIDYDESTSAEFFANIAGTWDDDDDRYELDGEAVPEGQIWGNAGLFVLQHTWDSVQLTNYSSRNMITHLIDVVDNSGVIIDVNVQNVPGGTDSPGNNVSLSESTLGGATFEFDLEHDFPETQVEIQNLHAPGTGAGPNITLDGNIENPIGRTFVHNDWGDIRAGSDTATEIIRTNTLELDADLGNVGEQGTTRRPLWVELIQFKDQTGAIQDIEVTAEAGKDLVLDLTANRRSDAMLGATFDVEITSLRAGDDVDVVVNDSKEGNDQGAVGNVQVHDHGTTPVNGTFLKHFRPDETLGGLADILRAFGTTTTEIDSTYTFSEVRAGDDIDISHVSTTADYGEPKTSATTALSGTNSSNYTAVSDVPDKTVNFVLFSDADADLTDLDTLLAVAAPPDGTPKIDLATNGDITVTEQIGNMLVGHIHSTTGDVTLTAPARILDADGVSGIDVTAVNITMTSGEVTTDTPAPAQGGIGLTDDFLEINVDRNNGTRVLNAFDNRDETTSHGGIFLSELTGPMEVDTVEAITDISLRTVNGSILDARSDGTGDTDANLIGQTIALDANGTGASIGALANDLEIDSRVGSSGGADDVGLEATANIYLTETDGNLRLVFAHTYAGDIRLTVRDSADHDEDLELLASGTARFAENATTAPGNDSDAPRSVAHGQIFAEQGAVLLRVGDDVTLDPNSEIVAAAAIDIYGDINATDDTIGTSDPDTHWGTTMILRGRLVANAQVTAGDPVGTYLPSSAAPDATKITRIWGNAEVDSFQFGDTTGIGGTTAWGSAGYIFLGSKTRVYGSQDADSTGNDGEDRFVVYYLQDTATATSPANASVVAEHALTLDGQADTDRYEIYTTGSTGIDNRNYVINVLDTGEKDDGVDTLTLHGTGSADVFLLRGMNSIPGENSTSPAFAALRHGTIAQIKSNEGSTEVQRVNYDESVNGRLMVYGYGGEDYFATDDNSAIATLDGGAGADSFQIGQVYKSQRAANADLLPCDYFNTIETTRGFLSQGATFPVTAIGGEGNDKFSVYSNKAELRLEGNEGDDEFIIRAFALVGSSGFSSTGLTQVKAGEGTDYIEYNINAPVDIDGGTGFDKVVALGTEFGDAFVITEEGVYGAGLHVTFENVEILEVDGLEGDDNFYVQSTPYGAVVNVIGGLGTDTFNATGDVTAEIISRDLEGRSGIIEHQVSADTEIGPPVGYDNLLAPGIDLNIAGAPGTSASGNVVIEESAGFTRVSEEGATIDYYDIYLASAPTALVYVNVSAVMSPYKDQLAGGDTILLSIDGVNFHRTIYVNGLLTVVQNKALALAFTTTNYATAQRVYVKAVDVDAASQENDILSEGERIAAISHSTSSTDLNYNHVAVRNVKVEIQDNDKAGLVITESQDSTVVLEGVEPYWITDSYMVKLTRAPGAGETVAVNLLHDSQVGLYSDAAMTVAISSLTFASANWNTAQTVYVKAVNDSVRENRMISVIEHSVSSTGGTVFSSVSEEPWVKVDVVDNDTPGVIVTETDGATLVVMGDAAGDTYALRLARNPGAQVVTISLVSDGQTILSGTDTRFTAGAGDAAPTVTFNSTNWWQPVTITVTANAAYVPEPGTQYVKHFPLDYHTTSKLHGPVFIGGFVLEGSDRSIARPVMLPGETSALTPDGEVGSFTGTGEAAATDQMTVDTADLQAVVDHLTDDSLTQISDLATYAYTLEISDGPGLGRFWSITAVAVEGSTTTLTLKNPSVLETALGLGMTPGQLAAWLPDSSSQYTVTRMSPTFFVDESEQVDRLNVYNDSSFSDDSGTLTSSNISGLGMAANLTLTDGDGTTSTFAGGISYGAVEILDVLLGIGNDTFTIQSTLTTGADHGGLTVVHGGGNTPLPTEVMGGDQVTITGGGGPTSPLVVFGDTSQDGIRYAGESGVINKELGGLIYEHTLGAEYYDQPGIPVGIAFAYAGNDEINAGTNTPAAGAFGADALGIVIYGGPGNDTITGSQLGDVLAGGSGNDEIYGQAGDDQIYGDSGISIEMTSRILSVPTTNTSVYPSRDSLVAGQDTLSGNAGADVIFGDHGVVTQMLSAVQKILNVRTIQELRTDQPANGAADTIHGNAGRDRVFGGNGADTITGNENEDTIFGDQGHVVYTGADLATLQLIESVDTQASYGDGDGITDDASDDIILGGQGTDTIDAGGGNNVVFGDNGRIRSAATGATNFSSQPITLGLVETIDSLIGGVDEIDTGTGLDIILGGIGGDTINAFASGVDPENEAALAAAAAIDSNNIVIGDSGYIDWTAEDTGRTYADTTTPACDTLPGDDTDASDIDRIWSTEPDDGGVDNITTGDADDIVIGGEDGDILNAGHGDNLVFGDNGQITAAATGATNFSSQPITLGLVETIESLIGGVDQINTGTGEDIVLGGIGGDTIVANYGKTLTNGVDNDVNNLVIGDSGYIDWTAEDTGRVYADTTTPARYAAGR